MKKLISMTLVAAMALTMGACSAKKETTETTTSEAATTEAVNNETTVAATETTSSETTTETEQNEGTKDNEEEGAVGYLSYLNLSENDIKLRRESEIPAYLYLIDKGIIEAKNEKSIHLDKCIFYDSLDAMLMGLMSGEVKELNVPDCTAKYLTKVNDNVEQATLYYPEKAEGFSKDLIGRLSNGYSFMMLEKNRDLCDQFDRVIAEMKEDGTLNELIQTHIVDAANSGETEAVAFEKFDGDSIRVAVTGALPPMDYVAADGSFAGFNTAILAEIGKRLEKNIELIQVDSMGRAPALAQGNVDAVFWTRGIPDRVADYHVQSMNEEEFNAFKKEKMSTQTEEEATIMSNLFGAVSKETYITRDRPDGTIVTAPYYTDLNVEVTLK